MVESEYAGAVYELAIEENSVELFKDYFEVVTKALKDKDFYNLMTSPVITTAEKKDIIGKVFHEFNETYLNFLKVIADHHRFSKFDLIAEQYNKLYTENAGVLNVDVESAQALSKEELERIKNALALRYRGKKIIINNTVNPKLIGGLTVLCNGEVIDITAKTALDKLKSSL